MNIKNNDTKAVKFLENDSPPGKDKHERQVPPDHYPATVRNKQKIVIWT